jgi:hypothetical protein
MPSKVSLNVAGRFAGAVTVFDAEPFFELLQVAFPEARSITWRFYPDEDCDPRWLAGAASYVRQRRTEGRFTVELGDQYATSWAD